MSIVIKAFFTVIVGGVLFLILKSCFSESNEPAAGENKSSSTVYSSIPDNEIISFRSIDNGKIHTFSLTEKGVDIGRADLAPRDMCMSRKHINIRAKEGSVILSALNQNNPIIVTDRDMRILSRYNRSFEISERKSVIKLGESTFEVMIPSRYVHASSKKETNSFDGGTRFYYKID